MDIDADEDHAWVVLRSMARIVFTYGRMMVSNVSE
jgi:hypothetical protein